MIEINKILSKIGCCEACILRYVGSKNPNFFNDAESAVKKMDIECKVVNADTSIEDNEATGEESGEPSVKRRKVSPCICCLGLLQKDFWPDMLNKIKVVIDESNYGTDTFACALTSPTCILLREHSINLYLMQELPKWKPDNVTSLKEAWKWSFGVKMADTIDKKMDSGAVCPFLIKANMLYSSEMEELETLRAMCPSIFAERERSHRKFHGEMFTRKGVEGMLTNITPTVFRQHFRCPPDTPKSTAECATVELWHLPIYIAGRYCKYSRELSQTPWILEGKRMMESSIQDIIFEPLVNLYGIPLEESTKKFKFLSSGREDVDVRCLGEGRPFAVEISDPKGVTLDDATLRELSAAMCRDKATIQVRDLQVVSREELTILKMGEETKSKTYVALCVKLEENIISKKDNLRTNRNENGANACLRTDDNKDLSNGDNKSNSDEKENESDAARSEILSRVTQEDLDKLNTYRNNDDGGITIKQKTPLRVLHRRPLLVRERCIFELKGNLVEGRPNLFMVEMTTQAGTYIKEFIHGDFGRTKPNLSEILGFKVDILALDVKSVNLDWPKRLGRES